MPRDGNMMRHASLQDLDTLVEIENKAFATDRFSRRSFRYLLTRAKAETLVYILNDKMIGYVMLLFHSGISMARLYSLALDPDSRGKGIGRELMQAAEQTALSHDCIILRLEVRADNTSAIRLYQQQGYRQFDKTPDYYEDHMEALRFEKRLQPSLKPDLKRVPYYRQTLDFTCGPATLMMAMKALDPAVALDRKLELRLWRESTTIYMTSGHGGCGPYGLALAAYRHGFDVEIYVNEEGVMFIDSVRNQDKKEVMRLVQEDFTESLQQLPVDLHYGALDVTDLQEKFNAGGIPIVLISSYRIYHEKFPHWVVVTGFDEKYIYVHDSYIDSKGDKTELDTSDMPILKKDFELMARYGKAGQRAVLILKKRSNTKQ